MKKVLFISYYFNPDKSVAAKRMSYWAQHLKQHTANIEIDVVTATNTTNCIYDTIDNVYYVPDNRKGLLSKLFKTDKGASWFYALREFFSQARDVTYDTVIISGNPFLHFFIARYFKHKMKSEVILDFRDPFAKNSRAVTSDISVRFKKKILILLEYYFCGFSDKIIVPNIYCKDLLCSRNKDKVLIIDNGYDEYYLDDVKPVDLFDNAKKTLVYLGTTAKDRHMSYLVQANEESIKKFNLLHVGRKSSDVVDEEKVKSTGLIDYQNAIAYTKGCDVGILLATGSLFESSSKIFDYIGMRLPMLIITNGEVKVGNVHELTKNYPLVWWSKNNIQDITQALNQISESDFKSSHRFERSIYSRKFGLAQLVNFCEL